MTSEPSQVMWVKVRSVDSRGNEAVSNVRGCAQEVISAHLLHKDDGVRDALIDEYVEEFGIELLHCLFDFIYMHVVEDLDERVAVVKFNFMLNSLGGLVGAVARENNDTPFDLTMLLAASTYAGAEVSEGRVFALKAAQTCLVVHMLVRQGEEPWGVQQNLDLADMCAVTQVLGDMISTLMRGVQEVVSDAFLIKELLPRVEDILRRSAAAQGKTVEAVLAEYWAELALLDCEQN